MNKPLIMTTLAHLMGQGTTFGNTTQHGFIPPAQSKPNAGFKRNRRAEIKRSRK